ncbi:MAG: sigma-54-dependent transcriptional regulator [Bdellovibrionales bacterium]
MKSLILAVDNDPLVLRSLNLAFQDAEIQVDTASSGYQAIALFKENPEKYPIVLLDYDMKNKNGEGMNGDEVAIALKQIQKSVRIVMLSGMSDAPEVVRSCLAAGAEKFICKSSEPEHLLTTVSSMIFEGEDADSEESEEERRAKISRVLKMVGHSRELAKVADMISKFSAYDEPVLILGESGVGKEGIARAVHENSKRAGKHFVAINCAAFGKDVLESELFGHERGSFTGALHKKIGLFEQANGGTIFLDEIGDMPYDLQAKVLRALQEKTIRPVGATTEKKIDFRVVAATHCDLKVLAEQNRFRHDLYYRLKYLTVDVPPLRERPEDIEPLARHFLSQMDAKTGLRKTISDSAMRRLKSYCWPGNVRDLEAVVKKAHALVEKRITPLDLENELTESAISSVDAILERGEIMSHKEFMRKKEDEERKLLSRAMELSGNVKSAAAALLGLNHNTMNYRRELLGIGEKKAPLAKAVAD